MKIMHITTCLLGGGIQNFLVSLLPEQVKMGHEVCLVVIEKNTRDYCFYLENVLKEHGVKVENLGKVRHNKLSLVKTLFRIRQFAKRWCPDIINAHGAMSDTYGKVASIGTKFVQIDTIHNGPEIWQLPNKILNGHDPLIFCSHAAYDLRVQKNTDIIAIDNGVAPNIVRSNEKIDLIRDYNLPPDSKVIVSVGSLRKQKNYTLLKDIFDELKDSSIHFFICGGNYGYGEVDESDFKDYQSNIHFLGLRSDVSKIENGANLFLSCALYEGLPIAVLESFFNGIPCVLSPIPQHEKISHNVDSVFIPESFDAKAFANSIKQALKINDSHDVIYQKREETIEKFSITETARKYIQFYQNHLN